MLHNQKVNIVNELENLRNENSAVKRAVESKTAAIGILRSELKECQRERDEFRMMAENQPRSQPLSSFKCVPSFPEKTPSAILSGSENTLVQLFSLSKEENKNLRLEITDLRCRLHDALSDLKTLRIEKSRKTDIHQKRLSVTMNSLLAQQERENLIQQLEQLSSKSEALETDVRCLLEEREELIKEREETRQKLHRMNHILNVLLKRNGSTDDKKRTNRVVDLDAIITENRYFQQRLKQLEEEKSLAIANSAKYKTALESCRSRTNSHSLKLGTPESLIMSPKQVSEYLKQYEGEIGENAEKDLKYLCVALLDALNQKSRAIKTQKAANKMLVERVADLEKRLIHCNADHDSKSTSSDASLVSLSLMDGYNPNLSQASQLEIIDIETIYEEINTHPQVNNEKTEPEKCPVPKDSDQSNSERSGFCVEDNSSESEEKSLNSSESDKRSEYANKSFKSQHSNSDSEEIVPLENLDLYISNLKLKRASDVSKEGKIVCEDKLPDRTLDAEFNESESVSPLSKVTDNSSELSDRSFEIDISDYESDDENLQKTLQRWQNECELTTSSQTIISRLSPKRSVSGILKKKSWKDKKVEFPEKLKEILK